MCKTLAAAVDLVEILAIVLNTSNRKMCCRGRDNNTNQGFGGKKESRNKKQTRRRQVLAGFVDHTRKRTRRPSGYQPGISIKRRVEYSNPKCSQFCACGSSSLLSMFFSEEDGLGGVGGLYGHSSWALAHIMRWVPQAQRQPNTMCSAQCGEQRAATVRAPTSTGHSPTLNAQYLFGRRR